MNRFLNEPNIKQRVKKIQENVQTIVKNIPESVTQEAFQQDFQESVKEEIEEVSKKTLKEITEGISEEELPAASEKTQTPKKAKRKSKKAAEKEHQKSLESVMEEIAEEHPEVAPKPQGTKVNVTMDFQNHPVYKVDKIGNIETDMYRDLQKGIKDMNKNDMINKDILLKKQKETNAELESEYIELQIYIKMKTNIDDKLASIYDAKIKKIQANIKELELRASVIANLVANR